ncbi:exodeoxyribonuclease VII large subunit [Candidatus Marinamargulisbacteria bacterium SCGC AG-343-D04]|nr:exodeoxyribonuclease VII large subunit [Candidatus Marinamargulisbacteria bacterium SCGC AG-343-D04]
MVQQTVMETLSLEQKQFTVTEINSIIKTILEECPFTQDIWISGEITQLNFYQRGNQYYFNLSDGESTINCVIYSNVIPLLTFKLEKGQHIFARGKIRYFHKKGTLIFQVSYLSEHGIGNEHKKLTALTQQLSKEGLFDSIHKLSIPSFPTSIAVITSPDSAAMWDFVTTLRATTHYVKLFIVPAVVQGDHSAFSLIEAIDRAIRKNVDLITIIRGGGSAEDLSSFNNELLVRKIFACSIPIQVGIGHKTDDHLCDHVADLSCVTPTACAEYIAGPFKQIREQLIQNLRQISYHIEHKVQKDRDSVFQTLSNMTVIMKSKLEATTLNIKHLLSSLSEANPLSRLSKGFSITEFKGKRLHSVANLKKGDRLETFFHNGSITSRIDEVLPKTPLA